MGLALVLALISLQQVWAAAFCLCDHQGITQAAEMDACEHHTATPAEDHHAGMHHHNSAEMNHGHMHHDSSQASRSATESECVSETGGKPGSHQPSTMSCCHVQPQSDVPVASFSFQPPSLEAAESLPQFALRAAQWLPVVGVPKPSRSRPVYLTVSAFLI